MAQRLLAREILVTAVAAGSFAFLATSLVAAPPGPTDEGPVPAILKVKAVKPAPGDDELRKLLIARYNTAVAEMKVRHTEFLAHRLTVADFVDVARHVLDSGLELSDKPGDQLAWRQRFLELAREVERIEKVRFDSGRDGEPELLSARYLRLDAEVQVVKAKRQVAKQRGR